MSYPFLRDAPLDGKRVLLRAGFDVPMDGGRMTDISRIEAVVPTMKHILASGASLIIMAHQDRPKGKIVPEMSQCPLVSVLEKLLGVAVQFASSCTGPETKQMVDALTPGNVLLLENLRFDAREEQNDEGFAKELASYADIYVNDAFANCHRAHASMVAVAKLLPSSMGLQLEQEIEHLSKVVLQPVHPLVLIVGGAKIETKLPVIEQYLQTGDAILLGGAIANTFIAAEGMQVGSSLYEVEFLDKAREFLRESSKDDKATIHIPSDVIVALSATDASPLDLPLKDITADTAIYDLGRKTIEDYLKVIGTAGTVVWNGPLGMYEKKQFAGASKQIAEALHEAAQRGTTVIVGGGDTIDFHTMYNLPMSSYTFVSTGGGAMLAYLAGKTLPALEVLKDA